MTRRTPPLNALRSFEAAARHGSFARAAEELSVTPAAVSRQVKLLEDHFGIEFFDRAPGGVSLTPEARAYAAGLTRAFRQITAVNDEFRTQHTSSTLTVRGYTTFLVKWLVPRLPDFQKLHPHIRVRLATGSASRSAKAEADVLIRYGGGEWPGYAIVPLFRDELVAVCSAGMLRASHGRARLLTAQQIADMPLLDLEARHQDWLDWFAQAGVQAPAARPQAFEDLAVLLEFARRGLGVALAQRSYLGDDLASGSLVVVSREVLHRELGYWALASFEKSGKTKVSAFLDWLATQRPEGGAAESHALPVGVSKSKPGH